MTETLMSFWCLRYHFELILEIHFVFFKRQVASGVSFFKKYLDPKSSFYWNVFKVCFLAFQISRAVIARGGQGGPGPPTFLLVIFFIIINDSKKKLKNLQF